MLVNLFASITYDIVEKARVLDDKECSAKKCEQWLIVLCANGKDK